MPDYMQIVDWEKHYENNRTRELKKLDWVPMPNRHDGDGYTQLLEHPNGCAHFGAWCAMVEVASRCKPRGSLLRDGGKGHDPASLARMTHVPVAIWNEAIPRLIEIGWVAMVEIPQEGAGIPQEGAIAPPTQIAGGCAEGVGGTRTEGKGREGKERREGEEKGSAAPQCDADPPPPFVTLQDLKTANPNATLSAVENESLQAVVVAYGRDRILAAYRAHQKAKPGKPVRFFLTDLQQYLPAKAPPPPRPEPQCPACGGRPQETAGGDTYWCPGCHAWLQRNGDGKLHEIPEPERVDTAAARRAFERAPKAAEPAIDDIF